VLDFVGQGARVEVTANGASATLLIWAFHALASDAKADLVAPNADRRAAMEYLAAYEKDVVATRDAGLNLDGEAFVAWLVREEALALGGPPGEFADLPLEDASSTYERLLDSDTVEDLFVSERELIRLLQRFLARQLPR